jgi:hypothetical protein
VSIITFGFTVGSKAEMLKTTIESLEIMFGRK